MVAIVAAFNLAGCAIATDTVTLGYEPDKGVAPVSSASNAKVAVQVSDNRPEPKNKISFKINGLGMPMASILAANDPAQVLTDAVQSELHDRGFQIGTGAARVGIDLTTFFNTFKNGFFSDTADGVLFMTVTVTAADGKSTYSRAITGHKQLTDVMLASGDNTKLTLDAAMKDAVSQLMADPQFIAALLKTGSIAGKPTAESMPDPRVGS